MRPLFGPRTVVEAAFLVAVPVVALEVGAGWPVIIGSGAVAYLLVLALEGVLWRRGEHPAAAAETVETPAPAPAAPPEHVRVLRSEPEPAAAPEPVAPPAELEPVPVPVPVYEPPVLVPDPEPEPRPEPEPEPLPPAAEVIPIGIGASPRQWNVWDLEQLARENAGGDPVADEERTFLLLYLRDFAGADGLLPVDFDDLVRQSFGALVASR
jgi:hypothetical protein